MDSKWISFLERYQFVHNTHTNTHKYRNIQLYGVRGVKMDPAPMWRYVMNSENGGYVCIMWG